MKLLIIGSKEENYTTPPKRQIYWRKNCEKYHNDKASLHQIHIIQPRGYRGKQQAAKRRMQPQSTSSSFL